MKISAISKKYGVSKDTLYFYISKGLLIPRINGKQYLADETFERDLQMILKYRDWGFQLNEIHSALSIIRKNPPGEERKANQLLAGILRQRAETISEEILDLQTKLDEISKDTDALIGATEKLNEPSGKKLGMPLSMVPMLRCPKCGGSLDFFNSEMSQTQITNADISCTCGYKARIHEGILLTPNQNQSKYDQADVGKVIYSDVPDILTSLYQKSYYVMEKYLGDVLRNEAVVMETHLNAYFYLQYELDLLEKNNCRLILVDKYPEILMMYKEALESKGRDIDVMFIANDGTDLPIRHGMVDVFVDFFGSNEHQFFNETYLLDEIHEYLSDLSYVVGTYFSLPGSRQSIKNMMQYYPEATANNFNLSLFKEKLKSSGFIQIISEHIGETSDTGEDYRCLGFINEDEKIRLDSFLLRKGVPGSSTWASLLSDYK